ncbi:hypothetical protein E2C01_069757 [Portunus trituberculatus]|uniref:Uncharacterized protein n=1 Tax=Portunus trituberculatus TaxID=210409 RepID=A0A5B7HQW5_PORTR|nr:hypothetical protein [Portunus trituberculatus]
MSSVPNGNDRGFHTCGGCQHHRGSTRASHTTSAWPNASPVPARNLLKLNGKNRTPKSVSSAHPPAVSHTLLYAARRAGHHPLKSSRPPLPPPTFTWRAWRGLSRLHRYRHKEEACKTHEVNTGPYREPTQGGRQTPQQGPPSMLT